jgi:ribosome-binding factor A
LNSESDLRRRGHRDQALRRIVAEAFECELLPSLNDPLLEDLHVIHVEIQNLACIRVLLGPGSLETPRDAQDVEAALQRAENKLRMELASIVRVKRMPVLRLSYIPLPLWQKGGAREGDL